VCKCPVVLTVHCPPLSSSQPCDRTRTRSPSSSSMDKCSNRLSVLTERGVAVAETVTCSSRSPEKHLESYKYTGVYPVKTCRAHRYWYSSPRTPGHIFSYSSRVYFSSEWFRSVENKIRDKRKTGIKRKRFFLSFLVLSLHILNSLP